MEEMRILALALFLCGLVFGFTFGMLCCLDEDRGYEFLPIPSHHLQLVGLVSQQHH